MNPILLVLPILTLLMFDLGLTLRMGDFTLLARRPRAVVVGLVGQLVVLPAIAIALATLWGLSPIYYVGLVLIACCPGGSSSNVFSKLANGDVALSVTLTAFSSIITLVTMPLVIALALKLGGGSARTVELPVGNLLMQNLVLMFLPIVLGAALRHWRPSTAAAIDKVLSRLAFPLLMLLAGIFFVQHYRTIGAHIVDLGACVTALIVLAVLVASLMSRLSNFDNRVRRTLVIEVAMQNAAQAIAVASSPFIFNDAVMAVPAIIYALMMNIVLLTYVGMIRHLAQSNA